MKKKELKQFILRKYIMAESCTDAINKDKKTPVHDCWVDENWKENNKMGF